MTKTRKRRHVTNSTIQKRKRLRGGKSSKSDTKKLKMFNGILYSIKLSIARRIAGLLNSQVTTRINDRVLIGLPPALADQLRGQIDDVSVAMVSDMAKKGMDVGENMLKAAPGFGNALSLVAAVDKGLAAMKNARDAVDRIALEIEKVKEQLRAMGIDPDTEFPFLNNVPKIPQIPLLDSVERFFDASGDDAGDMNIPSMPTMPTMPTMPSVPSVPSIPTMPSTPNMNQLSNVSKTAAMTQMNGMKKGIPVPQLPKKPDIAKLGTIQKGGSTSCDAILKRTKMSMSDFHRCSRTQPHR